MKDNLEFHNIYLGPHNKDRVQSLENKLTSMGYNPDASYERQLFWP